MKQMLSHEDRRQLYRQLLYTLRHNLESDSKFEFSEASLLQLANPLLAKTYPSHLLELHVAKLFAALRSYTIIYPIRYMNTGPHPHYIVNPMYLEIKNPSTKAPYTVHDLIRCMMLLVIHEPYEIKEKIYALALEYRMRTPYSPWRKIINFYMADYLISMGCPREFVQCLTFTSFDPLYKSIYTAIDEFVKKQLMKNTSVGWGIL